MKSKVLMTVSLVMALIGTGVAQKHGGGMGGTSAGNSSMGGMEDRRRREWAPQTKAEA